jgi:hypothetical protein
MQFVSPLEAIKRLAAAQGIDVLNLVKTEEQIQQEQQQAQMAQAGQSLVGQAGQLAGTPMVDPSKNPEALEGMKNAAAMSQEQPT